jgi:hypothetical protein
MLSASTMIVMMIAMTASLNASRRVRVTPQSFHARASKREQLGREGPSACPGQRTRR